MQTILAIDPGRAKCGVAVLTVDRSVIERCIVPVALLPGVIANMVGIYRPVVLLVGDGTGSASIRAAIDGFGGVGGVGGVHGVRGIIPLVSVDESHTSELARVRYLADNPPCGLRRLLPSFLRTPEAPYDDYVAIILAERWLSYNQTDV